MMKRARLRRLVLPVLAGLVTSAVVAGYGMSARSAGSPPQATGQLAGQLTMPGLGAMPIYSYSTGVSNPGSVTSGGGAGAGKASFTTLSLMKNVDVSSPALALAVASGRRFADAAFTAQWGVGSSAASMKYELEDVLVESVQQSGAGGSAASESLSLAFGKIKWTYTDAAGTSTGTWSIVDNRAG